MKQFFLTMLGVFAGLVLFVVVLPIVLITMAIASASGPDIPRNSVLELDLRAGLSDQPASSPFALFGGSGLSVMQVVDVLSQAEADSSIKVLLIRLPETGMAPAAADEVRQAVRRFRASGKPVIAHSQGFMPSGAVMSSYMLGTAASELWMQGTAGFQAAGFSIDEMFLGRALDKYGVEAEFEQRYEYKNAVNTYTQSNFTAAHREATLSWMGSIYDSALGAAAHDRKMTPEAMKAVVEAGPWTAEEALERKLIDKVGQVEEAEGEALRRAGRGARLVGFDEYASAKGRDAGSGRNAIAVISGEGAILTGTGGGGFGSGPQISSDDMAQAIHDAVKDRDVKAIVLRVSSPGGSVEASDQIGAAVRAAKAAGKPVVVSMGTYAASGGYWISAEADWIVAQPTTLTGSIGVFGGKLVLAEALGRFGVDLRSLTVGGDYAAAYSSADGFSAEQRAAFARSMDRVYDDFVGLVSRGRDLPLDKARDLARGRVWTGAQALEHGLVDELGGVHEAIAKAKELAGIDAGEKVRIKRFPAEKSPFEALASAFGVSGEAARALIVVGGMLDDPEVKAVTRRIEADRLRRQGAEVLADRPLD